MREENDRNIENAVPEAAENIQPQEAPEAEQAPETAEAVSEAAEPASAPVEDDRENAPRQNRNPKGNSKKKKKKKKKRRAMTVLVIVLAVVLVLGVLLGYGLSRMGGGQAPEEEEPVAEPTVEATEIPAYDAFTEELTEQNQQALDSLAGEDGYFDEGASALLGEDEALDDEDGEDEIDEPDEDAVVVAEYGDGKHLMSDEVLEEYSEELSMYILSGYSEEEVAEMLLDDVLETMVSERVMAEHARELGLYDLNDDDRAAIEAEAAEVYSEYVEYYRETVVAEEGLTGEEADAAAKEYLLEAEGVTYEGLIAELGESWWEQKLFDEITKDVTVDDAAVRETYDELLEEQMLNFTEYPDDYEFSQMSGETIVYNLPGYRAVKLLMLGFEDDDTAIAVYNLIDELDAMDDEEDAALRQEREEALDGYYTPIEERADELLDQLREGADMDAMILAYGADEGMQNERLRAMGYYVSEDSMLWSEEFIAAAMDLEEIGEFSEPVRTEDGVCILQYLGEVPEGDVPLADVREALEEEALEIARYDVYDEQVEIWLDEANPSYYPERMQ